MFPTLVQAIDDTCLRDVNTGKCRFYGVLGEAEWAGDSAGLGVEDGCKVFGEESIGGSVVAWMKLSV